MRLAKAGWGNGDPERIMELPSTRVIQMLFYEVFLKEYEETFIEINKDHGK